MTVEYREKSHVHTQVQIYTTYTIHLRGTEAQLYLQYSPEKFILDKTCEIKYGQRKEMTLKMAKLMYTIHTHLNHPMEYSV